MKQKESTKKAEEVSGEQGKVDCCGAGHLYHYGHHAIKAIHAQCISSQEKSCKES